MGEVKFPPFASTNLKSVLFLLSLLSFSAYSNKFVVIGESHNNYNRVNHINQLIRSDYIDLNPKVIFLDLSMDHQLGVQEIFDFQTTKCIDSLFQLELCNNLYLEEYDKYVCNKDLINSNPYLKSCKSIVKNIAIVQSKYWESPEIVCYNKIFNPINQFLIYDSLRIKYSIGLKNEEASVLDSFKIKLVNKKLKKEDFIKFNNIVLSNYSIGLNNISIKEDYFLFKNIYLSIKNVKVLRSMDFEFESFINEIMQFYIDKYPYQNYLSWMGIFHVLKNDYPNFTSSIELLKHNNPSIEFKRIIILASFAPEPNYILHILSNRAFFTNPKSPFPRSIIDLDKSLFSRLDSSFAETEDSVFIVKPSLLITNQNLIKNFVEEIHVLKNAKWVEVDYFDKEKILLRK